MDKILKTFRQWTGSCDPVSQRVSVFEHIRDIHYKIDPGNIDPDEAMTGLLSEKSGSCEPKHFLLGFMYEKMALEVRYCTYEFLWSGLKLNYPDKLKALSKGLPPEYHLACRVKIGGKWTLIDCTWDDGLEGGGFEVNSTWDGSNNTSLAVKPVNEVIHKNIRERDMFVRKIRKRNTLKGNKAFLRFINGFNDWIEEVRNKKKQGRLLSN